LAACRFQAGCATRCVRPGSPSRPSPATARTTSTEHHEEHPDMKIIAIDYWRLPCRAIKESWDSDESVWPDAPPSFLVRITSEDGVTGVGEVTSQVWYLGETAEQIAGCLALYAQALVGQDANNIALAHQIMERT